MEIDQLRRLKHLSEIPTHSAESLEELKALVHAATVELIQCIHECGMCQYCENYIDCDSCIDRVKIDGHWCYEYVHPQCKKYRDSKCDKCKCYNEFQLRMEGDQNA